VGTAASSSTYLSLVTTGSKDAETVAVQRRLLDDMITKGRRKGDLPFVLEGHRGEEEDLPLNLEGDLLIVLEGLQKGDLLLVLEGHGGEEEDLLLDLEGDLLLVLEGRRKGAVKNRYCFRTVLWYKVVGF
jgi:hypothetical protein